MKAEIKEKETKKEREFPKLMIANDGDLVLFECHKKGMYISGKNYAKSHYSDNWHMDDFQDFEGSITLSND